MVTADGTKGLFVSLRLLLGLLLITAGMAFGASPASATTLTLCNYSSWPSDGTRCPYGLPPRHTYVDGRAASGAGSGNFYTEWYVAYTDSNASIAKYSFSAHPGSILYSPMPNNSQYLRGYAYAVTGSYANAALYNEGSY
jgi:hypothetical protein